MKSISLLTCVINLRGVLNEQKSFLEEQVVDRRVILK